MPRHSLRPLILSLTLLGSCATDPGSKGQDYDPSDRYGVLRTYIPEGTESVILGDINEAYTMLRTVMPSSMDPGGHLLFLYAASDQDFPQRPGFGDAEQIVIYDPGSRGLATGSYPKIGKAGIKEIVPSRGSVLWRRDPPSPDNSPLAQPWMAIHGDRYLMQSGKKGILEAAIQQSTGRKPYLPVQLPVGFDANAPVIVMRRLDSGAEPGQERRPDQHTPTIESYCFTGKATEIGFAGHIWLQANKPDLLRPYLKRYALELGGRFEKVDEHWWKIPARVRLGSPPKQGARILYLFALAGCKIAAVPGA